MKKLWLLLLILSLATPAWADKESFTTATLQDANASTGNGSTIAVDTYDTVSLQVIISASATIVFEGTVDGTNYIARTCVLTSDTSGLLASSITAAGTYQCNVAGIALFRARISANTGTVTVFARATTAIFGRGGGGGGGSLRVEELDAAPSVGSVVLFKVPNGSLTDNGSGSITFAPSAGAVTIDTTTVTGGVASDFLYVGAGPVLKQISITGLVLGGGASAPSAYAGTSCTNQALRLLSAAGAGTCVTLTSAYVDTSIWTGTASSGMLKASSQGILAAGTKGTDYVDVGTANSWGDGVKQTFNPDATNAGINVGGSATEPSVPAEGDIFYDSATLAVKVYQGAAWVTLGAAPATPTLDEVFDAGKIINGANSLANAVQIGDGVTPICLYTDGTLGPQVRPCTDADVKTIIPANFNWSLWDVENAAAVETFDPDAASVQAMWTYGAAYRPKKQIYFPAGALNVDGTQCGQPTERTINSGALRYTIICTDNDASTIYGEVQMPDAWDGGTVTLMGTFVQTAADTSNLNADIAMACRVDGDTINNTWGTEIAMDTAMGGSNKIDTVTTAAITPNGTCTGAGTLLQFRYQLDAAGTTTAVATLHHLGFKLTYSEKSRSS